MSTAKKLASPEEYLRIDRAAETKSQFYDGEIFAMAGESRKHNLIVANLIGELRSLLKNSLCQVYPSDMRVMVEASGLYTYPDVVVVCDHPKFLDDQDDTLLNPILLIEVLSDSTADYDRGRKFEHYRRLGSLQEYILVAQDKVHVERFRRQLQNEWNLWETNDIEARLDLQSAAGSLPLAEIYAKVELS